MYINMFIIYEIAITGIHSVIQVKLSNVELR
jgi:hypothetical protein